MSKKLSIICHLLFFSCLFSFSMDVDGWAKTTTTPVVVRKKIVQPTAKASEHKNAAGSNPFIKEDSPQPKSDISIEKELLSQLKMPAPGRQSTKQLPSSYDPKGKIDPFEPLIKEPPEVKTGALAHAETTTNPKTDLEKIDLGQLKLTGIILAPSKNLGLVEEASSKGYIVTTGTAIGSYGGRVADIKKDRIIVEEKMKDVYGNIYVQKKEMKLNKNSQFDR